MKNNNTGQHKGFGSLFYVANLMEIFERLAWYGFFAVSSIYMTTPISQGGAGFSDTERGAIQGIIPFFLYLLPVLTGALGDKFGYRRMFILSFCIMTPSYFLLGQVTSFSLFFIVMGFVAFGAACFKPIVVGTIAHSTNDQNRGLGFGIFYTMVNIGGFLGPLIAGAMRAISWDAVFMMSAFWIAINFIPVLLFYRDPVTLNNSSSNLKQVLKEAQTVLGNSRFALLMFVAISLLMAAGVGWLSYTQSFVGIAVWMVFNFVWHMAAKQNASRWWQQKIVVSNGKFTVYLLILSLFWTVYNQLFYTLPLFIRDFVDTRDLVAFIGIFGSGAVEFFAYVDQPALKDALNELFNSLSAVENVDIAALRLEWVHLKVNVPIEQLSDIVRQLQTLAATQSNLTSAQLNELTETLLTFRQINPEYLINLDFAAIVILQIAVSYFCQRFKPVSILAVGLVIIACAFLLLGQGGTMISGLVVTIVILLIAMGEMFTSPKSQEYVAFIAPKEQSALYMGYYFVSMALGFLFAGFLSGWSYSELALKAQKPELMWGMFALIALLACVLMLLFRAYTTKHGYALAQQPR
ncbi:MULTISPECIES: MFS transporter [Pseudoalteromonas]|uniref:MFS transporter n=1 Tax=Pseudoalteromonas amylolytica TaxID=1859457 RepID=A0A1S1MS88_9GAMM|nr:MULTISPECIES: MFS transporter [Pseudoalteromonas]OHU88125.1 MFS transporter [Pseudoalteromonas sp. JW3]OHU91565.1 MFS transporter [Pseudoalteromonas amylolytica]